MKTIHAKTNFGRGIASAYLAFVAMIIALVALSMSQKIDLVTDQYYDEELRFQDKINKVKNAQQLANPVTWEVTESGLQIQLAALSGNATRSGTIVLYCPADNLKDRKIEMNTTAATQHIDRTSIPAGRYLLQLDWQQGGKKYWQEGVVVIN